MYDSVYVHVFVVVCVCASVCMRMCSCMYLCVYVCYICGCVSVFVSLVCGCRCHVIHANMCAYMHVCGVHIHNTAYVMSVCTYMCVNYMCTMCIVPTNDCSRIYL